MLVQLKDVRLDFFALWEPKTPKFTPKPGEKPPEPRYEGTFIFDENSAPHIAVRDAMIAVAQEKWPQGWQNIVQALGKDKKCLRKGNENLDKSGQIRQGYEGKMYVSATNKLRPPVVQPVAKKPDGKGGFVPNLFDTPTPLVYRGVWVNANIDVYASTAFGNAIFAQLIGVQYVRPGEAFGGGMVSAEGFDDIPGAMDGGGFGGFDTPAPSPENSSFGL